MQLEKFFQDWPVDNVAGALVGRQEASFGDTARVFELASVTKLLSAYAERSLVTLASSKTRAVSPNDASCLPTSAPATLSTGQSWKNFSSCMAPTLRGAWSAFLVVSGLHSRGANLFELA